MTSAPGPRVGTGPRGAAAATRILPPLWLARPSRFAGWPRRRARWVAGALLLLLALLALLPAAGPATGTGGASQTTDLALYEGVIEGVRAGGDYYQLTADALRAGGYPLRPFLTFRLPTHSVVQALAPREVIVGILYFLALGVAAAWWVRLSAAFSRAAPRIIAMLLLGGGLIACIQADLIGFHEVWAAQLIALSLALRRPGRWLTAVAIGLIAMLVRETAALYPLVMATAAWLEGDRREATGWLGSLAVLAVVLGFHAHGVEMVISPLDPASPGWAGRLGPGFFFRALAGSTALALLPTAAAILFAALSIVGWLAWRDPLGLRVALLILGYGAAVALFARADTFYWALMPAPLSLVGIAFLPDAIRDLGASILDRRRVRVQRIAQ